MVFTITDVAKKLNDMYHEAIENRKFEGFGKGEKSQIFLWIMKDLFEKYGSYFGYDKISDFKSSVVTVQKRLKKGVFCYPIKQIPPIEKIDQHPKEGDGEIFLNWEITEFGLNLDSYY